MSAPPKFICLVLDSSSGFKHLYCAQQPDRARSVLSVKSPLKQSALEKYFVQESDLHSIKESLIEKPSVFTFDHVFRSAA